MIQAGTIATLVVTYLILFIMGTNWSWFAWYTGTIWMGKAIATYIFHILCGLESKSGKPIPNKNLFQLSPRTSIPRRKPKENLLRHQLGKRKLEGNLRKVHSDVSLGRENYASVVYPRIFAFSFMFLLLWWFAHQCAGNFCDCHVNIFPYFYMYVEYMK